MTKPKKTKNKTINSELSIREFKVWLDGLCSFNAVDWTPNLDQWNLIKHKLMNLKENADKPNHTGQQVLTNFNNLTQSNHIVPYQQPMTFNDLPPEELARKIEQAKTHGPTIKTPHLDTSNGSGYKSTFE